MLEIASGSGEHVVGFAAAFPELVWQPTDPDEESLRSITAWAAWAADAECSDRANLRAAQRLDVREWPWPVLRADAIVCINMIHISPWHATEGLFAGAGAALPPGGVLVLYGPYRMNGVTAPSNEAFDRSLRERDPAWGVRDTRELDLTATIVGLARRDTIAMPANNHCLIYRRAD